ncbi:hypothetical protein AMECASPLE_004168 [Ameca splendens]|uniref:Uncharacterized protein n=1 Tax=Ameca splendens TaxID=208324 RepID=A0ABV0Z7K5_9TELE
MMLPTPCLAVDESDLYNMASAADEAGIVRTEQRIHCTEFDRQDYESDLYNMASAADEAEIVRTEQRTHSTEFDRQKFYRQQRPPPVQVPVMATQTQEQSSSRRSFMSLREGKIPQSVNMMIKYIIIYTFGYC